MEDLEQNLEKLGKEKEKKEYIICENVAGATGSARYLPRWNAPEMLLLLILRGLLHSWLILAGPRT